ncbi:MAG: exodeoxyribonuclease VII large subunit [Chloroflexota bacterium]
MNLLESNEPFSQIWQVSDVNSYIREIFELDVNLKRLEVEGEISNFTAARSGHLYFTLKDDASQLKCVMWRSSAQRLRFDPREGDAVVLKGSISVYEASGVYQFYATSMRPAGRGELILAFERLKEKLQGEGLFDSERKQTLPRFPAKIGIVTSIDAAALRDIMNVLTRRYPIAEVLISPTLVQGGEAPPRIVRALEWLDGRDDIDVIIVARGGGSIEDLWAFNDEQVARAIAAARHPVISGVGHETDFTIADFVADVRAPTPSAAAELVTPDINILAEYVGGANQMMRQLIANQLASGFEAVETLQRTLKLLGPSNLIQSYRQRIDQLTMQLDNRSENLLSEKNHQLSLLAARLNAANPTAILERGFAIVTSEKRGIVRDEAQVEDGDRLSIRLATGEITTVVEKGS